MKRICVCILLPVLCLGLLLPACALEYTVDGRERDFAETAESLYPGWRTTSIYWYITGGEKYYGMILLRTADGMLWERGIVADWEDTAGTDWEVWDHVPVPLTAEGAAKAADALAAFTLSPAHYNDADDFLTQNGLLSQSAFLLLNEGETMAELHPYGGYLAGIAENAAGQRSLRIAGWDEAAYGPVLATPMQESLSINEYHSYDGYLEIYGATSEDWLELGEDGIWRLIVHTPDEGPRYYFAEEGIVDAQAEEFAFGANNDGWHYGVPAFPTTLPELVFTAIPDLEDAVQMLDAAGWACVKQEGAALYDAPDGHVLAACFCRLPGQVLERRTDWTLLQIGSAEGGRQAWFRTEDLAFGAKTEEVICSFPGYSFAGEEGEAAFELILEDALGDEPDYDDGWLIARQPDGDWLMLINHRLVRELPAELFGETWPTEHEWDESTWREYEDEYEYEDEDEYGEE